MSMAAPLVNTTKSIDKTRTVICPESGLITSFELNAKRGEYLEKQGVLMNLARFLCRVFFGVFGWFLGEAAFT